MSFQPFFHFTPQLGTNPYVLHKKYTLEIRISCNLVGHTCKNRRQPDTAGLVSINTRPAKGEGEQTEKIDGANLENSPRVDLT